MYLQDCSANLESDIGVMLKDPTRVFKYQVHMFWAEALQVVDGGHEFITRIRFLLAQPVDVLVNSSGGHRKW